MAPPSATLNSKEAIVISSSALYSYFFIGTITSSFFTVMR